MQLVNDPVTQRSACTALDALLEVLGDSIDQYLPLLMERLVVLLDSAPTSVKSVVIGAIGSAAHASKEKFLPYFQPSMDRFKHFLVLTGEGEEQELRGITMDAVGTFAEAVGKDAFRPYFSDMMQQAFNGIQLGSARLRECSFLFFGVMARVFGDEFAPYLPNVIPALIESCQQAEHEETQPTGGTLPLLPSALLDNHMISQHRTLKQQQVSRPAPHQPTRLQFPMRVAMLTLTGRPSTLTSCLMSTARSASRRRLRPIRLVPFLQQHKVISCHTLNNARWNW